MSPTRDRVDRTPPNNTETQNKKPNTLQKEVATFSLIFSFQCTKWNVTTFHRDFGGREGCPRTHDLALYGQKERNRLCFYPRRRQDLGRIAVGDVRDVNLRRDDVCPDLRLKREERRTNTAR